MALPVPTIDHVIVNALDRLDEVADLYRRLGFTLTPRGHHTLGSSNHLAVLGTDYIELLGVEPGVGNRTDVLEWPPGLNGLVFKTFDSDGLYAGLHAAGLPALPPQAFSRPVDTPTGPRDASFRTVRLERDAVPAGRIFFCHHLTPELVWDDAMRRHANGAIGIKRFVIAANDPTVMLGLFGRLFGDCAAHDTLAAGLAYVEVVKPSVLHQEFGTACADADGRQSYMAVLVLRTASLDRTAEALHAGGIASTRAHNAITVAAAQAGGVTLVFAP